jgi:hypothetical protein
MGFGGDGNGRGLGVKRDRRIWLKPPFLRMMDRSGWVTKPLQIRILAIDMPCELPGRNGWGTHGVVKDRKER